jgi:hypothetical protein
MHTRSLVQAPPLTLASGATVPDSKMAREVTELVRDTENGSEREFDEVPNWRGFRSFGVLG